MNERQQIEHLKLQEQIHRGRIEGSPRYLRAHRTATMILATMRDFIPQDRRVLDRIKDHLMEVAYQANAEIVSVPPEWDTLDKMSLIGAMFERKKSSLELVLPQASKAGENITITNDTVQTLRVKR
jgi:hypothetical protein